MLHQRVSAAFPFGGATLKTMGDTVSWEKGSQQLVGTKGFVYIPMMNGDCVRVCPVFSIGQEYYYALYIIFIISHKL